MSNSQFNSNTAGAPEHTRRANGEDPYRCPVCLGRGHVDSCFYLSSPLGASWSSNNTAFESCRSCSGTGVVWRKA